ncbi:MAG: hypothetical protein K6C10_08445 [Prevotella sp.]|nr:hypothetical protein [Prevotella sp.]
MCIFVRMKHEYDKLLKAIEKETGYKMQTPRDFEWLSENVEKRTKEHLSDSTLMRLWGYRPSVTTRLTTLDILSRFLGYADYVTFSQWYSKNKEDQSDEVLASHLSTKELEPGTKLVLTWYPERRCVVQLREDGSYIILEAENTKLSVGDTFQCELFIDGEPLYMNQLVHEGRPPMVYVAGKINGIRFAYFPEESETEAEDSQTEDSTT